MGSSRSMTYTTPLDTTWMSHIPRCCGHDHRTLDCPCIVRSRCRRGSGLRPIGRHHRCSAPCSSWSPRTSLEMRCRAGTNSRDFPISSASTPSSSSIGLSLSWYRSKTHHPRWTHGRLATLWHSNSYLTYCRSPSFHLAYSARRSSCTMTFELGWCQFDTQSVCPICRSSLSLDAPFICIFTNTTINYWSETKLVCNPPTDTWEST